MNCQSHPRNEVVGYCSVCGAFGCSECIVQHQGQLYCRRHYRPIAQKAEEERRQEELRKRHSRQKLVVRYLDGRLAYGYCLALNPRDVGFHIENVSKETGTATGQTTQIRFSELKAVFFVKSFDGNFDKATRHREWAPEGNELVVEFKDGEVIRGVTLHRYDVADPRFYLIPHDDKGNNVSVLVEASSLAGVYTPEEYAERKAAQKAQQKETVGTTLSQEETMGDFYFETRNYQGALEQYEAALKKFPQSARLRKKLLYTEYNMGVQCIKRRDFSEAMTWMQKVLRADPDNAHAKKKVVQLRRILEKGPKAESHESLD